MSAERIARGFDFIAPYYDFCSNLIFGKSLLRAQYRYFKSIETADSVLILGGGTGELLLPLSKYIQFEHLTYLDISPRMISLAVQHGGSLRIDAENKIEFIAGSTELLPENKRYSLIITPFVLDCLSKESLAKVMIQLDHHLKPGGIWLFSDFNVSKDNGRSSVLNHAMIKFLYLVFNLFCHLGIWQLPHFNEAFRKLGYTTLQESHSLGGLLVSRAYQKPTSIDQQYQ